MIFARLKRTFIDSGHVPLAHHQGTWTLLRGVDWNTAKFQVLCMSDDDNDDDFGMSLDCPPYGSFEVCGKDFEIEEVEVEQ